MDPVLVPVVITMSAVVGLLVGSFLNVVVYRVPAGLSVVRPASACPRCSHEIRGFDNVPVLSWLILRGRCRDCAAPISVRYPVVEAATAALFAIVALHAVGSIGVPVARTAPGLSVLLVAMLYLMAISVALALIDLDTTTLPNRIVLPAYIVLLVLLGGVSLLDGDWLALVRGLIGMAVLATVYLLLAIAVPGGMGLGDVKLAGVLGLVLAYLGRGPLAVGAFAAFFLGGTFSIVLLLTRRVGRKGGIPFGPWMLAGAWVGVFLGGPAWHAYLGLIGLV